MRLLLLRHAIAEDRVAWAARGRDDLERPLTAEGRKRMRRIAETLARLEPEIELVLTSRARRSIETAQILLAALPGEPAFVEAHELAPDGKATALLQRVAGHGQLGAVALVGHEPNLSCFAGLALAGRERSLIELRKGGAALLDFTTRVAPGAAVLAWLLPPAVSRRVG